MKKAIIVLVGMAVICIAAIGIMYLPEKIVDANSSSTIVQIENTCPAQPEPVNIVPNNTSNEVPILTYIQYDSLSNLLHDLLNGEIGKNSSISGPLIYHIDKNEIELLDNLEIDDTYTFKDVTLNLNNHSLIFGNNGFIQLDNTIITDGNFSIIGEYTEEHIVQSITNSVINNCNVEITAQANVLYAFYCDEDASLIVNNCNFVAKNSPIYSLYVVGSKGNLTVSGCVFSLSLDTDEEEENTYCIAILSKAGILNVKYTTINGLNRDIYGVVYGIFCNPSVEQASIKNCNIYTDSHYLMLNGTYGSTALGISARGMNTIIDSCTVRGIHSALSCAGDAVITNSYFESTGHGGIYFGRNARKDVEGNDLPVLYKVSNSTIAWSAPDGVFKEDFQHKDTAGDNGASCYIGGSTNATNITVYMDNCKLIGRRYAVVLRGTSNEHDNSLYITNTMADKPMRIDNETLKLYVGPGCNITQDSEVYWKKVKIVYSQIEGTSVVFEGSGAI